MTASQAAAGTPEEPSVRVADDGPVRIVTIDRPERRNAVDLATSHALTAAFAAFDADATASVAVLTGRPVAADEALAIGLADRVVAAGGALAASVALAHQLARLPQRCLRNDRLATIEQWSLPFGEAVRNEVRHALDTIASGETLAGAGQFAAGRGRGGRPADEEA